MYFHPALDLRNFATITRSQDSIRATRLRRGAMKFDPIDKNFEHPGVARSYYVIAGNPRSGSSLLATALARTGHAGAPHEYLNPPVMEYWLKALGSLDVPEYLSQITKINTSPNGVFGLKAHYFQLETALLDHGFDFEDIFPKVSYIRIKRADTIRQALSYARASQTGNWSAATRTGAVEKYNPAFIHQCWRFLVKWDEQWDMYFSKKKIEPLTLLYEELAYDYYGTVKRALEYLNIEDDSITIQSPPLKRQSDELTEEWYARFLRDTRPRGTLRPLRYRLGKWLRKRWQFRSTWLQKFFARRF